MRDEIWSVVVLSGREATFLTELIREEIGRHRWHKCADGEECEVIVVLDSIRERLAHRLEQ